LYECIVRNEISFCKIDEGVVRPCREPYFHESSRLLMIIKKSSASNSGVAAELDTLRSKNEAGLRAEVRVLVPVDSQLSK
jgi:hypothetical protein